MATLSISLFGTLQIKLGAQPVSDFKSDKVRALLAYLAVEADRPHRREALAALLWPEMPDRSARGNLRDALANLRQVVGDREATPPYLLIERNTIQFDASSDQWLDVARFCELVEADRADQPAHQQLAEAIDLYRGSFLEGFSLRDSPAFDDWSLLTRERLRRQALLALSRLATHHEGQGDYEQACDHARRQVELEPWDEEAHRHLMQLLALDGQRGAALLQYENCRQSLAEELGVEPAAETTSLFEQIRDGTLAVPGAVPAAEVLPGREPRLVGDCPYRGLAAFREQDAPFFHGREGFAQRLHQAVHQHPLVTVIVGSSGSGKSSVVAAGLLPRLREDGNWLVASFRPGRRPFSALAGALLPLLERQLSETDRLLEVEKLAQALYDGDLELQQVVGRINEKEGGEKRLLLVGDQFEELYTLCPNPGTRRRFVDSLLEAAASGAGKSVPPLVILLSLRADFMGQALSHRPFANALQDASLMLGPMTREEMQAAIEMPAQKQGALFEAGLVNRILDDVGDEPGNLPLLEFALTLLWERADSGWLTHEAYDAIDRVDGALARYAGEVYAALDEAQRDAARRVFLQLIRPGQGTEDSRRVATRAEIGEQNWPLAQHLADRRLVVTGLDSAGAQIVEVVHEALIAGWARLQDWIETDRAFRTWQEGLRAALHQWELSDHDEGSLLRGTPLVQAEGWLAERGTELSPGEREFIGAGAALRQARQARRERRRRWTILALAGGMVIAVVLAVVALGARGRAEREATVNHSLVLAASAQQADASGEVDLALALAVEAVNMDQPPTEAKRTLSAIALGPGTRTIFKGHSSNVRDVAISPDSRTALSGSCAESGSDGACSKGELILWDLSAVAGTVTELRRFKGHSGWVNAVAFSPDGQNALSGSGDGTLIWWDVETGQVVRRLEGHTGSVNSVALSPVTPEGPGGQTALSGSDDATLILWDVATGEPIRRFEGHTGGVNSVALSPDTETGTGGQSALSGSADTTLILWDVASGEAVRRFEGHINEVEGVEFTLDGRTMLSAGDNTLRTWDLVTGEEIRQQATGCMPDLFAISPDGRTAMLQMVSLALWDIESWRTAQSLVADVPYDVFLESAAFSPDARLALSGYSDGTMRLWNTEGQVEFRRFATEGTPLSAVAINPDGRRILTGDMAGVATLWDAESGEGIRRFERDAVPVCPNCIAFSPDGRYALVGSADHFGGSRAKSLELWNTETGEEIRRFEGHRYILRSVAISPDGRTALSGSQAYDDQIGEPGELILWDLATGEEIRRFDNTDDITSIAFSTDGSRALTGSAYLENAKLWDVASGQEILRPEAYTNMVLDVAFGPDETDALSASADGSLFLWDVTTGQVIRRFLGHEDLVLSVDVSPDGRYVLSGSMDGDVILWDFETAEELRRFRGHTEGVFDLVFSPDGQVAYSVALDGALIEWQIADPSLDELRDWIHANRYVRELTCAERAEYRVEPLCAAEEPASTAAP
jgi:WD40 repeat protein/DNA-binding SARP family transcriptional activator